MPLSFRTENHGSIAFGFFNIESDMLLLEHYFFFADLFCGQMVDLAGMDDLELKTFKNQVYYIADPDDIGDLMGAIHGIRFKGFIGRLYELFPFPDDPDAFKQNPEGYETRNVVKPIVESFSTMKDMPMVFHEKDQVSIGSYLFDKSVFHELIRYVWNGGYPGWKQEIRPPYTVQMKESIQNSSNPFFKGVF